MAPAFVPTYEFDFSAGVNWRGAYFRTTPHFDGGRPKRFRFALNDDRLVLPLGITLGPELADLIDVFAAARIADARAPQSVPDMPRLPKVVPYRCIRLIVGVRCPALWKSSRIRIAVEELLAWLTGDEWALDFVLRSNDPRRSEAQGSLLGSQMPGRPAVRLHSGGLDSWLGLAASLGSGEADAVLAVSVVSHPRIGKLVRDVLTKTRSAAGADAPALIGLSLGLHHVQSTGQFADRDSSQRTRILSCLATGIAIAALGGTDELRVTENGVGAINLRNIPGQIGAMMNRATHPRTLHLAADIASMILHRPIRIVNDGLFRTKAELLSEHNEGRFVEAIRATASCERLPWYAAQRACGICASCILRRLAIDASVNHDNDDVRHRDLDHDLFSQPIDPLSTEAAPLLAFAAQAGTLRGALAEVTPYEALRARFPELVHLELEAGTLNLEPTDLRHGIVRLYRRHLREWDQFASSVPTFADAPSQLPLPLASLPMIAAS